MGIGRTQSHLHEGSCLCCCIESLDEFWTAVGIDGMVASMIRHHHIFQAIALGNADSYREHDAITKRHHCRLHVVGSIVAFGNLFPTLQKRALEIGGHEVQRNHNMPDAQLPAMPLGEGYLLGIVLRAIVKRDSQGNTLPLII